MDFDYAVALTGGIATGKSTVSKILSTKDYDIIDADTIAHEVLEIEKSAIADMFGSNLIVDGRVDRKALGAIVFADKTQRKRLEELLHPLIRFEISKRAKELERLQKPYLIDIPLFFERGDYPIGKTLVVYAPRVLQISRLMERNGFSKSEALQRIEAQMDIEHKRSKATYLIENTGDLEELEDACRRVDNKIRVDFGYNSVKNG